MMMIMTVMMTIIIIIIYAWVFLPINTGCHGISQSVFDISVNKTLNFLI